MGGHFGSGHYIGELLPWLAIATALLAAAAVGLRRFASRTAGRVPKWLQASLIVVALIVLWEHLFLLVYELGPISGCPDGGMYSGLFVMKFVHSGYVVEYVGMPLAARIFFHVAAAIGFVLAGAAAGRVTWTAAAWGGLFAAPYAVWRSASMWYTEVGWPSGPSPSIRTLLDWVGPLAIEVAVLVASGALLSAALRRWSPSNPALQPPPQSRRG